MENITPILPDEARVKRKKYIISIIIFILAVLVAYLAWYVNNKKPQTASEVPVLAPLAKETVISPETEASLGGGIYEQAQNPIKDNIPNSVAPTTNPIGGAYKNPFE